MNFGLILANFGERSDPRTLAELASMAEGSGWDGVFLPDTIQMVGAESLDTSDPWIDLAAMAMTTARVRLGLIVSTPARYRPWHLARQAATIDHLSRGRLILGVGLGDAYDRAFEVFHEEPNLRRRAAMLDEALEIIDGLWSGDEFRYDGEHFQVEPITLLPPPVQRPRIPLWVGWKWPNRKPMARAARWDGAVPFAMEGDDYIDLNPAQLGQVVAELEALRTEDGPYDLVAYGPILAAQHSEAALQNLRALDEAGATWLVEFVGPEVDTDSLHQAITNGPPRLD